MKLALFLCVTLASMNLAVAQTPPQPSTNPSSASSPHQRDTTTTPAKEAATPTSPDPAAASSPHQQRTTEGADKTKAQHDKMMADCTAKQQSMNSSMSKDQATKACKEQMKDKMRSEQPK